MTKKISHKSQKRQILIVDDLKDAADTLVRLLELMGHDARAVYDGLEAMDLFSTFKPDVLLLDLGMPKRSGYDVCCYVRGQPWGRDVLIIAITALGQPVDYRRTRQAGFDHHLVKPDSFDALCKLLDGPSMKREPNYMLPSGTECSD